MKFTTIWSAFLLLLFLIGCNAQQFTINNLPKEQLHFGSGGGMTGAVDTYILLENGQLFHQNSLTKEVLELEPISKANAKAYFAKVNEPSFTELEFNHPGNRYSFITHKSDAKDHKIVWGSTKEELPTAYKTLYTTLIAHLK